MFQLMNSILLEFMRCFNRIKTWQWFVVLMVGFMVRSNHKGITSIVSILRLKPKLYNTMLHFFRSTGYTSEALYDKWIKIVMERVTVQRIADRVVVLGDHIKISKEGRRMPDIQVHHQDSENAGKPKYIEGHNYGQVSAVITNGTVSRSLPLKTAMQKSPPKKEGTKKPDGDTLVVQMVKQIHEIAKSIGEPVIAALDAYFCSASAWVAAEQTISETGEKLVEIVTRAQSNTVAFKVPEPPTIKGRGRPRIYGDKVALYDLFSDMSGFIETNMTLYGKKTVVKYRCLDLIWRPVKKQVRFVLVETDRGSCVLMSTSLTLTAEEIIAIYALRFKIETSFAEQKNDIGCFSYRFWTMALPKRKKWRKGIGVDEPCKGTADARRATTSFVCLSTIATGILTVIAFSHSGDIWKRYPGWLKTRRSIIPSVATVRETLTQELPVFLQLFPHLPFCSIINFRQRKVEFFYEDDVA